jgi:hypothetical protein
MPEFDAIVVPGGGVWDGGRLPPWAVERFDLALQMANGAPILALSGGTAYRPSPLDPSGRVIFESIAGADYLLSKGFPAERILFEYASYDTIGNAFFARTIFCDPRGWKRLLVITSEFHMPRTEDIFRYVFSLEADYELEFRATPDTGMPADLLPARLEKEQQSLEMFREVRSALTTYKAFQDWLFTRHDLYAAPRRGKGVMQIPDKALRTY